jgi:ATP-dependent DNA helicase RecG
MADARDWYARFQTVKSTFSSRVGQISNAALRRGVIAYDENTDDAEKAQCRQDTEVLCILTGLEIDSAKSGVKHDLSEYLEERRGRKSLFLRYKAIVDDKEERKWYEDTELTRKDIYEKCKLIRPAYTPIIGKDDLNGQAFLIIWCPGGDSRPYSSPKTMAKENKERYHYIRKGSVTAIPNDDEQKDLFALANRTPFDDRVNHEAEISDINYTLVKSYLKEIGSSLYDSADAMDFTELCGSMNLISVLPEYVKPKNVALMFFNPEPEKFFPYAQIDVVQFPEGDAGDKIIEQTFTGPLHEQLRAALRYIRNVIITEQVVKVPGRAEADRFFNYPYEAIEEALSNAVYHKAYDEREPIEVRVEKGMIEIISHPGPDRSVTLEGLRTFKVRSRRYRNRRIGEFLKELHLTEGRNTGFKKILDALNKNGSPLPEFETDEAHDYFITRLFVREGFYDYFSHDANDANHDANSVQIQERIMDLLRENPRITQAKLADAIGVSRATIQRTMKEMVESNQIVRFGSTRGYWQINV